MSARLSAESAKSHLRAVVARAVATALITGIDNASEEGHALTQLQQIDLATMHVMAYEEALDACKTLDFEAEYIEPVVRDPESWQAVANAGRRAK